MSLEEAVLEAGAVRFMPIFLTAATVIAGALGIILDPIFQGLAVALMTGVFASTLLTLVLIPLLAAVVYYRTLECWSLQLMHRAASRLQSTSAQG